MSTSISLIYADINVNSTVYHHKKKCSIIASLISVSHDTDHLSSKSNTCPEIKTRRKSIFSRANWGHSQQLTLTESWAFQTMKQHAHCFFLSVFVEIERGYMLNKVTWDLKRSGKKKKGLSNSCVHDGIWGPDHVLKAENVATFECENLQHRLLIWESMWYECDCGEVVLHPFRVVAGIHYAKVLKFNNCVN